jgi:DNA-binding CsgD family transcriptional regulator
LKKVRVFPKLNEPEKKGQANGSNPIVFCEKTTGVTRFRAVADGDANVLLERAAGMLAMQCLVRGHDPADFEMLVPANQTLVEQVAMRAAELLREGRAISNPPLLSARQREILHSVLCNRANKEIASQLNITVRTVKFHISTLLEKFDAQNRSELAQRAAGILRPSTMEREALSVVQPVPSEKRHELGPMPVYRARAKGRSVRFPGRILTA